MSAVHNCLFSIFTATLHVWKPVLHRLSLCCETVCMSSAWGSSRTWCIGHVARMVNVRNFCEIWVEKPGGKKPLGRPRLWWSIIATLILGKLYYRVWIGLIWLRIRTGRNSYKNQRHYQLINKFVLRFFFFFFCLLVA